MTSTVRIKAKAGIHISALLLISNSAAAQSWTPAKGETSLTTLYQLVDNTGHRMSDGFVFREGQSTSMGVLAEVERGITERLALNASLPFIGTRYHGNGPAPGNLPVDTCRCWHSGFADFTVAARYRFGGSSAAITPSAALVIPSHAYNYRGEAVIGKRLKELRLGAFVGYRPASAPRLSMSASYAYSIVESARVDVPNDRSNASLNLGYAIGERWSAQAGLSWQRTHGGLRFGSIQPGASLPFPGEVGLSGPKFEEHDRLLRDNFSKVNALVSRGFDRFDVFVAASFYVSGTDSHLGRGLTLGTTWYFGNSGVK